MSKVMKLEEGVNLIEDGMTIAIGGNVLHRAPMAFLREIVRQGKKGLRVVKTAGGHDVDLLCAGGCVSVVDAGFISYETEYGLASYYRKAVQDGLVKSNEHACYTVISALRAAKAGVSFMPVKGIINSDLVKVNDYFKVISDPFTGEDITVVRAIEPDVAIIHVQECDEKGNGIIRGPVYDDELIALSSKRIILTTEKIINRPYLTTSPKEVTIPGFLVSGVIPARKGASPCSCPTLYDIDKNVLKSFLSGTEKDKDKTLSEYLARYERADRYGGRQRF
ncbi:MAG: CoA transferase subunit A [Clostridiales Family XIII bacterium]|nr:CoA transferase subunit A [Clostridiales Family XIII bacterium]